MTEGSLTLSNGYFTDTNSASKYYWGLNTRHAGGNPGITEFGWINFGGGVEISGASDKAAAYNTPCTGGFYPMCASTEDAPWQNGFVVISLGLAHSYVTQPTYVRQAAAGYLIGLANNAATLTINGISDPYWAIATEYIATRAGTSDGTATGFSSAGINDTTAETLTSWSTILSLICNYQSLTSGCTGDELGGPGHVEGAYGRWQTGPDEQESYPAIQMASLASSADIDASPCPLRSSGSLPCGLVTYQYLQSSAGGSGMPNQADFPLYREWDFAPWTSGSQCAITTTSCPNAHPGVSYTCSVAVTGCAAPSWSISAGALPAWASLNSTAGAITGTPSGATPTTSSFTVEVTDANGNPTLATSILDCTPPTITTGTALPTAVVGGAYSTSFTATEDATITWSATGLPSFLSLSTSGTLSGTPTSGGPFAFNVTAANSCGAQGPTAFTVQVNAGVRALSGTAGLTGTATVH